MADFSNEYALCPVIEELYNIPCEEASTDPVRVVLGENIKETDQI